MRHLEERSSDTASQEEDPLELSINIYYFNLHVSSKN